MRGDFLIKTTIEGGMEGEKARRKLRMTSLDLMMKGDCSKLNEREPDIVANGVVGRTNLHVGYLRT